LSIRVNLFLKKDGKLIAQAVLKDHKRFEIPEIREQVRQLYRQVVSKLPYDGLILSRQGNRVTINLGKSDGIKKGQSLTAVQIISATRHPKFNFLLSTEKEIIGQLKVLKVDDTLSFAAIISEKERNAVQKLAKISGVQQVVYGEPDSLEPGGGKDSGVTGRADAPVSFGQNPREWVPVAPPSFGQVGIQLGLGTFTASISKNNQTRDGASQMYPNAILMGELWLNPNWIAKMELRQGIATTSNPDEESNASDANHLLSRYALGLGYNFLLRDDFWGPKIQVTAGYFNYRDSVAESERLTTTVSGMQIGVNGTFPLTDEKIWFIGGGLNVFLSGTARDFRLFAERKVAENMRAVGGVEFSAYQSAKGGADLVQRHTILSGGINYMF
ncbi:MAG TPA: hypothetical protein VM432_07915, partial [Bdellovibrionales bacterium]|nr:hypothetical protein [Bdellovibrionales bacterium]